MAKTSAKKKSKKPVLRAKGKSMPKPKAKAKAPAKKVAQPKRPNLTVVRIVERPVVRVARAEVRIAAKTPVAPATFRAAGSIGRLLPPPLREE